MLLSRLLCRVSDRAKRVAAAKLIIETVDPLWFGAECVRWFYFTDRPEKRDRNTLTKEQVTAVRQVLVDRIKTCATGGAPLFDFGLPQDVSLLHEWRRAEGRDPVQSHLLDIFTKNSKQIPRFLQSLAPIRWDGTPRVGELGAAQLEQIELFIDLGAMADLIRKHCFGDFDNPKWPSDEAIPLEQRMTEQFMFLYRHLKGDEPPDT